jgi:pilus assembly protein Flp/PilA
MVSRRRTGSENKERRTMLEQLKKLVKDEEAPTAVEYALMVAAIAAVIVVAVQLIGTNSNKVFDTVAGKIK